MKVIETEWNRFSKVLPPNAGETQIKETRRAFYAGYVSLMAIMEGEIAELHEDDGVKVLESIKQEINQYGEDLKNGKA